MDFLFNLWGFTTQALAPVVVAVGPLPTGHFSPAVVIRPERSYAFTVLVATLTQELPKVTHCSNTLLCKNGLVSH
jgi:hypothetical protein